MTTIEIIPYYVVISRRHDKDAFPLIINGLSTTRNNLSHFILSEYIMNLLDNDNKKYESYTDLVYNYFSDNSTDVDPFMGYYFYNNDWHYFNYQENEFMEVYYIRYHELYEQRNEYYGNTGDDEQYDIYNDQTRITKK